MIYNHSPHYLSKVWATHARTHTTHAANVFLGIVRFPLHRLDFWEIGRNNSPFMMFAPSLDYSLLLHTSRTQFNRGLLRESELIPAEMCCLIRDGHGVSIRLGTPLHRRFPQTTTGWKISVIPLAKENSTLVMLDVILLCKSCWLAFSKVDMMSFIFPHSLYVSSTRGGLRFDTYLEYIVFIMAWSPLSHHVSLPLLMHLLPVSVPCSLAALFSSVDVKLNPTLLCFLSWITDYKDERSCILYSWGTAFIS